MKKILIFSGIIAALSGDVVARAETRKEAINQTNHEADTELEKAIDEALKAVKKESPLVHEDSLRVWKNFSSQTSAPVNFTYRFWGRRIILWLKKEKKMGFESEQQVGAIFDVIFRKGLISKDAAVVLMVDAWAHLIYLEGVPSWEKRVERQSPGRRMMSNGSIERVTY